MKRRLVVIVVPDRAHLLDVAGAAQVFVCADELGGAYDVHFVGEAGAVTTHQGLPLALQRAWPDLVADDLVLVPGWKAELSTDVPFTTATLARIADHHGNGGHVASICSGALALAEAGLLAGRRATTHHELTSRLAQFAGVTVVEDVLYVCSERLHTSAGIASGIDLALHLVAEDHGPALAARVARTLVVPAWRPGGSSQTPVALQHRDHLSDLVHRAQDLLDDAATKDWPLAALSWQLGVSERTLTRRFVAAIGLTPHAYLALVRREQADRLVGMGWTREAAAREVGYADARSLRGRSG